MHGILSRIGLRTAATAVGAGLVCLWLAACHSHDPKITEDLAPEVQEARAIVPGESIVVEFALDDHWHKSGYLALAGDKITCRPVGPARRLSEKALLVHIGRERPMFVGSMSGIRISQGGEIVFKAVPKYTQGYGDPMVRVQIRCLREAEEDQVDAAPSTKKIPYRKLDE